MEKKQLVMDIVQAAQKLINKYNIDVSYKIDMIDIFPKSIEEEKQLNKEYNKISSNIKNTIHGNIYILKKEIDSIIGTINNIKVRNYDPKKKYRGAIDLIVNDFDDYKDSIEYKENINFISNDINDFIEYEDYDIFLYVVRNSNVNSD